MQVWSCAGRLLVKTRAVNIYPKPNPNLNPKPNANPNPNPIKTRTIYKCQVWVLTVQVLKGHCAGHKDIATSRDARACQRNKPSDQMSALQVYGSSVVVSHAITSGAILSKHN